MQESSSHKDNPVCPVQWGISRLLSIQKRTPGVPTWLPSQGRSGTCSEQHHQQNGAGWGILGLHGRFAESPLQTWVQNKRHWQALQSNQEAQKEARSCSATPRSWFRSPSAHQSHPNTNIWRSRWQEGSSAWTQNKVELETSSSHWGRRNTGQDVEIIQTMSQERNAPSGSARIHHQEVKQISWERRPTRTRKCQLGGRSSPHWTGNPIRCTQWKIGTR